VVDVVWTPCSPLRDAACHDDVRGSAGIVLSEVPDPHLVQVMTRRGQGAAIATIVKAHLGVEPPQTGQALLSGETILLWSGPGQFLILSRDEPPWLVGLREHLIGIASLSDQSHGRCWLRLSGRRVRNMLAKISSLDLHPTTFPIGAAAATSIEHTAANFWRSADGEDGSPVFNMLVFASFATSIRDALIEASREYDPVCAPRAE
jgi:heterotetrameric sarcosine oxidase gamma subunit